MYRSSPARTYGPLAALVAAQLVVVLVAPSTAPTAAPATALGAGGVLDPSLAAGGGAAPGTVLPDGTVVPATGGAGGAVAGGTGAVGTGGAAGGAVAPGAPGAVGTAGGTTGGATAAAAGDTSHCRNGRQFDPAIEFFAPPCVPGRPGTPVENGGATSFGVSKDRIVVAHYIPDYGAEVNAMLRAQGLFYDATNARVANAAFQAFLNSTYQTYGRKIEIRTFQGTCRTVPPDLQCLVPEMNRMVDTLKPFAVFFQTTVCSACFAELARRKVVSFGGAGFSEEFRQELRPYDYDYGMSSTLMAKLFAQWWCGSMAGKPAAYAGSQNELQDFRTVRRQLGVVSTNDPDNERVVKRVLYPELATCGESVRGHEYFYEQNVSTAATQSQAGTAIMNSRENPATSVVCFCDPVAPQFSYNAAKNNNYWPEALFATNQAMDTDSTGQTYMGDLACPAPKSRGCSFDGALGLGQSEKARPPAELGGIKVFKAKSKAAVPLQPLIMEIFWQNYYAAGQGRPGPRLIGGRARTAGTAPAAVPETGPARADRPRGIGRFATERSGPPRRLR